MTVPCLPGLFFEPPAPNPSPIQRELRRRGKNEQRVLDRLRQGPATTLELVAVGGIRATGRVSDLRKAGFTINAEHVKDGLWRYRLVREP